MVQWSKANVLEFLRTQASELFTVLPAQVISFAQWQTNPVDVSEALGELGDEVIVRSNFSHEDGEHASFAGQFKSVANVATADPGALRVAIDAVFASYLARTPYLET